VLGRSATSGEGADTVLRLALAEETASYGPARAQLVHPDLATALETARRGLLGAPPRRARLRARLWPASLMAGAGGRMAEAVARRIPRRVPRPARRGRRARPV